MLYLFYGENTIAMRDKIQEYVRLYPATAIHRVRIKELDYGSFSDYFRSKSMFDDKQLVVVEGKFDIKRCALDDAKGENSAADVIIMIDGSVKSNEALYKAVQDLDGVIIKFESEPDKDIFSFLDAVGRRQRKVALVELQKLFLDSKDPVYIQTMLVWQYRNIIAPDLTKGFVQKKSLELRNLYTNNELFKIYAGLYQLEVRLKTGEGMQEALIEEFVVRLTR